MNKLLKKVGVLLKPQFTYFKDENLLAVSEDKTTAPYAFIISEKPGHLYLSFRIDYPFITNCVQMALDIAKLSKVTQAEGFFISKLGQIHFGDDAMKYYEFEMYAPLEDIDPECKSLH